MKKRLAMTCGLVAMLIAVLATTLLVNHTPTRAASVSADAKVTSLAAAAATPLPNINTFPKKIEAYASYAPQTKCSPKEKPGVVAFEKMFLKAFPGTGSYGISRSCSVSGTSEHKEGRAWDWKISSKQKASVDKALKWLFATDKYGNKHAMIRRLGIMYIIWNGKIWGSYRAKDGWRTYSGASEHKDHVHFSFSVAGANKTTSFWK